MYIADPIQYVYLAVTPSCRDCPWVCSICHIITYPPIDLHHRGRPVSSAIIHASPSQTELHIHIRRSVRPVLQLLTFYYSPRDTYNMSSIIIFVNAILSVIFKPDVKSNNKRWNITATCCHLAVSCINDFCYFVIFRCHEGRTNTFLWKARSPPMLTSYFLS